MEGLTAAAFANANPSVDCPALAAGTAYCVGGPTSTLQFGSTDLTRGCRKFYKVSAGEVRSWPKSLDLARE